MRANSSLMLFMVMNSREVSKEKEEGKKGQEVRKKLEGQKKRQSFQNKKDGRLGDGMGKQRAVMSDTRHGHKIHDNKSLGRGRRWGERKKGV